jgi:hypothetical protein
VRAAALLALALASCGWNPTEGDFGPVEVVPEERTCYDTTRVIEPGAPSRRVIKPRRCDGRGHDVLLFDKWRW